MRGPNSEEEREEKLASAEGKAREKKGRERDKL